MSEVVKKYQAFIEAKQAKSVGKAGLRIKTDELLQDFFNDICKVILNADDELFLIQWGIIKLNDEEAKEVKDAASKG